MHARARDVEVNLDIPLPPDHESLGVVVPWSPTRFQYTAKDVGRSARARYGWATPPTSSSTRSLCSTTAGVGGPTA
ncbi:DUF2804 family protein [Mycobacterium sp. CBMA271]|uniref:DUF2804 family protein n=1 Tax=unclassified Mycobacteroides TaxID=2618759 RepID=UPI00132669BB|nr:DUF2804 family protein [Mycobacteroides sp. CBMA 271]